MTHRVPYFDMDDFYTVPPPSNQSALKNTQEDEVMELVWHNGELGVQNQSQRVFRKSSPEPLKSRAEQLLNQPPPETTSSSTQLLIQEDEMTSWLHYPLDDDDTCFGRNLTNLLYQPPPAPPPSSVSPSLAISPANLQTRPDSRPPPPVTVNFPHFSRLKSRFPESGQSASSRNPNCRTQSAVVDSNHTPKSSSAVKPSGVGGSSCIPGTSTATGSCNLTLTTFGIGSSFSGASATATATATADLVTQPPADDRKRKAADNHSEDLEIESSEATKQCPGTASGKRSRATEVHNLSERKRRDRINEKMKALQDLIPRCTKRNQTDKASMLDEAIEYLKSLQLQVQMMSMGCYGVVPMMFPGGVQQYMPVPPMGVSQPMVTFPGAASAVGPRFAFPSFPTPPVPTFDPSKVQSNPHGAPGANFVSMPTSADLYHQYLAALQMQTERENQQPASTLSNSNPTTSRETER